MKNFAKILFKIRSYTPLPFVLAMLIFYNGNITSWIVGSIILLVGEAIRIWGIKHAGSLTRTTTSVKAGTLITSGPFAYVRNPLYIGNILIYFGYGVISLALFPFLQIIALFWFAFQYVLIVSIEEEFLENKFGEQYRNYKKLVPRFIPKFKTSNNLFKNSEQLNVKQVIKSELRTLQALASVAFISFIIHMVK